jgi:hypothetical protein
MTFSANLAATAREAFDDNIEALVPSPAKLSKEGQALFDKGRELVKEIAAALPDETSHLYASISGHAPERKGDFAHSSLTVSVNETSAPAGFGG